MEEQDICTGVMNDELTLDELCIITQEASPAPDGCFDTIENILRQQGRHGWADRLMRLQIDAGIERQLRDPDAFRFDPDDAPAQEEILDWDQEPYSPYQASWEEDYQPLARIRLGLLATIYSGLIDPLVRDRLKDVMHRLAVAEARVLPMPALRLEP